MLVVFYHRVENDEEFSHACGQYDFGEFALSLETISEGFNFRVVLASAHRSHVQRAANGMRDRRKWNGVL